MFRPDLRGKPVVVLSNNDGCVVARSQEAKRLGIPEGIPYYQLAERFPDQQIAVFSSNYELYGDLTARVMSIISQSCPEFYRYSIDEAFCVLDDQPADNLKQWGEELRQKVLKWTGMPVSIGIAKTKTLAKMADRYAKDYPGYRHCCVIATDEQRDKALLLFPLKKVWGIGRRHLEFLEGLGLKTAYDLAMRPRSWVRSQMHVTGERTWRELWGEDCVPMEEMAAKKSICTSRSFPGMLTEYTDLRTQVANYAARCAEKLRKQHSVCQNVMVFLQTNHFRDDLPQYDNSAFVNLLTPDNATQVVVDAAFSALKRIYQKGFHYKRGGVIVSAISDEAAVQTNFLDFDPVRRNKLNSLTKAVDRINRINGAETIVLGVQQYTRTDGKGKAGSFRDAIRHDFRSRNYTTRWSDIMEVS